MELNTLLSPKVLQNEARKAKRQDWLHRRCLPEGNEERCPVMLFKVYLEKRPEEMKTTGPFYLSVIDKPVSNVWFKKTPMGKNTIDSIMKKMKLNSPLIDLCPEKRITNHSARKTVVKKLKSSGIPKYHGTHICAGSR